LANILSLMHELPIGHQHHHHTVAYSSTASELRAAVCKHEMIGIISRPLFPHRKLMLWGLVKLLCLSIDQATADALGPVVSFRSYPM
jgi:hypothetical protein